MWYKRILIIAVLATAVLVQGIGAEKFASGKEYMRFKKEKSLKKSKMLFKLKGGAKRMTVKKKRVNYPFAFMLLGAPVPHTVAYS